MQDIPEARNLLRGKLGRISFSLGLLGAQHVLGREPIINCTDMHNTTVFASNGRSLVLKTEGRLAANTLYLVRA